MIMFLFFTPECYTSGRAKLHQFVTNLRTAKNCKSIKKSIFTTCYSLIPVRTPNLQNNLRGLDKNPIISISLSPHPVSGETPSPYGRECPMGQLSSVEGEQRNLSQSQN